VIQQPMPLPPNPAMIQPQSLNSGTIPSAIPSPISPQSITYPNTITLRQNSFRSNYSTPSPYTHNIIATPVNNIYYPAEANIATPVHIISPPPPHLINPALSTYSFSSQEIMENGTGNNYARSTDANFDKLSKKSYNSINYNSSYDDSLYYHDIVDNTNGNNSNEEEENYSSITRRSNTIGGSQNIRNELKSKSKGEGSNQYLHPNSYSLRNNSFSYDPIPRSNSCTYDRSNSFHHDSNINPNHSFSYDNTMRIISKMISIEIIAMII